MFKKASLLATGLALALVSACGTSHHVVYHPAPVVIVHHHAPVVIVHKKTTVHVYHRTTVVHHYVAPRTRVN